jgi:hypothetical protein
VKGSDKRQREGGNKKHITQAQKAFSASQQPTLEHNKQNKFLSFSFLFTQTITTSNPRLPLPIFFISLNHSPLIQKIKKMHKL